MVLCYSTNETALEHTIKTIQLSETHRFILFDRYIRILKEYQHRIWYLTIAFNSARFIVTVGSILVPALLSILSQNQQIYWITWTCSLLVTISHGLISIFKIDKKYFLLHTVREQLLSEGWQYLELSCKYSGYFTPTEPPTHENQFVFFTAAIERLRIKHIQEEYLKLKDKEHKETIKRDEYMPESPFKNTPASQELTKKLLSYLSQPEIVSKNEYKKNTSAETDNSDDEKDSEDRSTKSVSVLQDV
jgi:hypothetical protein